MPCVWMMTLLVDDDADLSIPRTVLAARRMRRATCRAAALGAGEVVIVFAAHPRRVRRRRVSGDLLQTLTLRARVCGQFDLRTRSASDSLGESLARRTYQPPQGWHPLHRGDVHHARSYASGRTTNYIAIKQDVTERRADEAARQFLSAIIEPTEDAVVGSTLDGKIRTWNRGAEKLHGYRADEVLGQSFMILLAPEHHDQTAKYQKACNAAEPTLWFILGRCERMENECRFRFPCL